MKKLILIALTVILYFNGFGQSAEGYNNRGISKHDLQDYRGAIADYSKAIELDPNDAGAYINRGVSKISLGQKDSGCLDFSKAGELGAERAYEAIKELCN
jgi:tetratricopeptide (TPR) repeat protein